METARERGGRFYPCGIGAKGVLDALVRRAKQAGVRIDRNCRVTGLKKRGDTFLLLGDGFKIRARTTVLATGGASYPWTGSQGDGYGLAGKLGHTITPLVPALVPVLCADAVVPHMAGVRLKNVRLTAAVTPPVETFGEVHFTDFGISGPAVFPVSRGIAVAARKGPVLLTLDFKPALDEKKLDARLLRDIGSAGKKSLKGLLAGLLPLQAVDPFLAAAGLEPGARAAELSRGDRRTMLSFLKSFPLTATGTLPLERAMVTAGGVKLGEIDPGTMESRIVPGLFICGELLDLDGTTGGFNLQAAFTTGFFAGRGAAGTAAKRQ